MTPVRALGPRVLEGRFIRLEPLSESHHTKLVEAAADPETWTYIPIIDFSKRLGWMVEENAQGRMLSFVVVRKSDGAVLGSTSYLAIVPQDARVEVGFTWYVAEARGGSVNPEAKYLLLNNAFAAHYNRVEFKTDARNARSRAALHKLGATEEGVLRGHMWMPQGYFRDSVYFSILAAEWPHLRAALENRLAEYA